MSTRRWAAAFAAGLAPALSTVVHAADASEAIIVAADGERSPTAPSLEATRADLATIPGGTDLVAGETIRRGRAMTLRDALQTSPGVYVQPRNGAEESRLSIRGSGIQRTFHLRGIVLLQDGQPLNLADGGGDFQAIDPALASHIAVYRGGNALRFGAATLGGAIDVITPTGRSSPGTMARFEAGSFDYAKAMVATGAAEGDLDGHVAVSGSTIEGYRDHSRQENQRASANVGWRIAPTLENRLYVSYANSNSELPGSLTRAQFEGDPEQANADNVRRDVKRDFPLLRIADRIAWDVGALRAQAGVGYMRKDLFHPLAFGLIDQESDDVTGFARLSGEDDWLGVPTRLTLGGNGAYGVTDAEVWNYVGGFASTGHVPNQRTSDALQEAVTVEAYAEVQAEVVERWWLVAGAQGVGARRENDDQRPIDGDQSGADAFHGFNPKLGVLWEATPRVQAFANASRSFEPPTFSEYVQVDVAGGPSLPQSDLEAQSAWTAEIGTRGAPMDGERLAWDITLYYALVSEEYVSVDQGGGLSRTVNADDTLHYGAEAGLALAVIDDVAGGHRLVLDTSYGWGRFAFDDDAAFGDNRLPGLPEHHVRAELRYERGPWHIGPVVEWQDDWYVDFANTVEADGEALVGLRGGYRQARGVSAFIEGKNLLDTAYTATTGIANPASAVAAQDQALWNPGDGLAVIAGIEWRH
ncbi:MAG TPA: TonB-dependent receptor [Planctomycetota bacterium]|nr:TonB-dependent receptor [Planctomycetota bacterium]